MKTHEQLNTFDKTKTVEFDLGGGRKRSLVLKEYKAIVWVTLEGGKKIRRHKTKHNVRQVE